MQVDRVGWPCARVPRSDGVGAVPRTRHGNLFWSPGLVPHGDIQRPGQHFRQDGARHSPAPPPRRVAG
eukprot:8991411-Alexandrium_andersonii.AAC.1